MEKIEECARALCEAQGVRRIDANEMARAREEALAVLQALFPPSEGMVRAVDKAGHEHWPNARKMANGMMEAMIQSILSHGG